MQALCPSLDEEQINAKDHKGNTALMYAVRAKNHSMVDFLLAKGASKTIENDKGKLPLMYAMKTGSREMMQRLLDQFQVTYSEEQREKIINKALTTQNTLLIDLLLDNDYLTLKDIKDFLNVKGQNKYPTLNSFSEIRNKITQFEIACRLHANRLESYRHDPVAAEKIAILTKASKILTDSTSCSEDKYKKFCNNIAGHQETLCKPHSNLPKTILKGLAVFVGLVLGIAPGVLLYQRFFSSSRKTLTGQSVVEPVLKELPCSRSF